MNYMTRELQNPNGRQGNMKMREMWRFNRSDNGWTVLHILYIMNNNMSLTSGHYKDHGYDSSIRAHLNPDSPPHNVGGLTNLRPVLISKS